MKIDQIKQLILEETNPVIKEKLEVLLNTTLKFHKEQFQLINELSSIGIEVESVWDLVNNKFTLSQMYGDFTGKYEHAYHILVKHLDKEYHIRIKEGIIRALTEKNAKNIASNKLLDMFNKEKDKNLKWVLANALRTLLTWKERQKYPEIKNTLNGQ